MKTITAGYTGLRGEKLRLRVTTTVSRLPPGRFVATAEFRSLSGEYSPITATKNFSSSDQSLEIRSRPLDSLKFPSRHSVTINVRPAGGGDVIATHSQEFVTAGLTPELAKKLGVMTEIQN
jgi:hypothetical protein